MRKYFARGAGEDVEFLEAVHATTYQDKPLILDKLIVDCLRVNLLRFPNLVDFGSNLGEVERLLGFFKYQERPVARNLRVDVAPFREAELPVRTYREFLGDRYVVYACVVRGHYSRFPCCALKGRDEFGGKGRSPLYVGVRKAPKGVVGLIFGVKCRNTARLEGATDDVAILAHVSRYEVVAAHAVVLF